MLCFFCFFLVFFPYKDYMQNVHGKEIDLLRTTVKVPGKRPPRAVATVAPTASPKSNGFSKDRSTLQLGIGSTGECLRPCNFSPFQAQFPKGFASFYLVDKSLNCLSMTHCTGIALSRTFQNSPKGGPSLRS